ncbi:MAG: hypothetical protein NXY59_08930 [Aigarchaeota archaeon]|nr:hypothetical protein [Candidatus Pelearchaeum maunauluense]
MGVYYSAADIEEVEAAIQTAGESRVKAEKYLFILFRFFVNE